MLSPRSRSKIMQNHCTSSVQAALLLLYPKRTCSNPSSKRNLLRVVRLVGEFLLQLLLGREGLLDTARRARDETHARGVESVLLEVGSESSVLVYADCQFSRKREEGGTYWSCGPQGSRERGRRPLWPKRLLGLSRSRRDRWPAPVQRGRPR